MNYGKEYFDFCKKEHGFDMTSKGDWQRAYVEMQIRVFPDLKTMKCLDFGCAMGATTSTFNDNGVNMVGVDVSPWYVENSPFTDLKGKLFSYTGKLPFSSKQFDFIHSQQVVEHIPEPDLLPTLKEIARVCKRGALVYIATTEEDNTPIESRGDPTHCACLSKEKWIELFKSVGLVDVSSDYQPKYESESFYKQYNWVQFVFKRI